MPTQSYIIEGKFLGEAKIPMDMTYALVHQPYSLAFFCPICGEVWALCPVKENPIFHARTVLCRKHPSTILQISGSVIIPNKPILFPSHLPDELVRWEFDRHMAYMEQCYDN